MAYFIRALSHSIDKERNESPIYLSGEDCLKNDMHPLFFRDLLVEQQPSDRCTLKFISRLELKKYGKYPDVTFRLFFNSLIERIAALAYLHCGIRCGIDEIEALKNRAKEIRTLSNDLYWEASERYSNKQKRRMPFGGWKGEISFEGELTSFIPFVRLGEWIHAGKKSSFGFGQYKIKNKAV